MTNQRLPREKKKLSAEKKSAGDETIREKEKGNEDYWDRIAEDPASGYKNEGSDDPLLNTDQQPEDNMKGDQAS